MSSTSPCPENLLTDCLGDAVRRACRGWLSHHADDISQTTCLQLVCRARESHVRLTPAYVRRAARHAVVDTVRRYDRRDALWTRHQSAAQLHSNPRDPEGELLAGELASAVRKELASLAEPRRRAVSLYLQGHGISEIAAKQAWSRKKADNLVRRGLATVRGALTRQGLSPQ